ncbi:MAG: hypothetical protein ACLVG9_01170 [Eubacteriales bacterium]
MDKNGCQNGNQLRQGMAGRKMETSLSNGRPARKHRAGHTFPKYIAFGVSFPAGKGETAKNSNFGSQHHHEMVIICCSSVIKCYLPATAG